MKLFKSKAYTLLSIKLKKSIIPKIYIIKFSDYKAYQDKILQNIKKKFLNQTIICVESSLDGIIPRM